MIRSHALWITCRAVRSRIPDTFRRPFVPDRSTKDFGHGSGLLSGVTGNVVCHGSRTGLPSPGVASACPCSVRVASGGAEYAWASGAAVSGAAAGARAGALRPLPGGGAAQCPPQPHGVRVPRGRSHDRADPGPDVARGGAALGRADAGEAGGAGEPPGARRRCAGGPGAGALGGLSGRSGPARPGPLGDQSELALGFVHPQ